MQATNLRNLAGRLSSYELVVILALTLVVLARPRWGVVALGLIVAVWAIRWLSQGRLSVRTPLDWAIAGILLALPASLWISPDRTLSMAWAAQLIVSVALFYAVANSDVDGWPFALAVILPVAGGAGLALLGLLGATHSGSQVLGLPQQLIDLGLPFKIHANVLATGLVLILPLAAALALWDNPARLPGWTRGVIALAALLMLLALILSQSRGGYAGLLAAAGLMALLRWRWTRWIALPAIVAGILLALTIGRDLSETLLAGILGREAVWLRSIYAIRDFPLSGVGYGLFDRIVPVLYPYFVLGAGPLAHPTHAHNLFLQVAVDAGLPSLISVLALLLTAAALAVNLWRNGDPAHRPLVWGLSGSLIAVVAHGLVDAGIWSSKAGPLLWLLLGLLVALAQVQTRREGTT